MAKTPAGKRPDGICCGLGREVCPEAFRRNDRDVAEVPKPGGAPEEKIQEAMGGGPAPGAP